MPETFTREGIDRTAQKMREAAARDGISITHEQARRRVVAAVERAERENRK